MPSDENFESEKDVVVQVEDEETSKGDNSVKSNIRGDKFVPHKSNRVKRPTSQRETDSKKCDKNTKSDSSIQSLKQSKNSNKKNDKSSKSSFIDVKGEENTEKTENYLKANERKLSLENDYMNQDTCNEIEEEIFSEHTDRTRAEDFADDEVNEVDDNKADSDKDDNVDFKDKSISYYGDHEVDNHCIVEADTNSDIDYIGKESDEGKVDSDIDRESEADVETEEANKTNGEKILDKIILCTLYLFSHYLSIF